jgi:hypothetical protein
MTARAALCPTLLPAAMIADDGRRIGLDSARRRGVDAVALTGSHLIGGCQHQSYGARCCEQRLYFCCSFGLSFDVIDTAPAPPDPPPEARWSRTTGFVFGFGLGL